MAEQTEFAVLYKNSDRLKNNNLHTVFSLIKLIIQHYNNNYLVTQINKIISIYTYFIKLSLFMVLVLYLKKKK